MQSNFESMRPGQELDSIKCIVIDDEYHCLRILEILLQRISYPIEIIKLCNGPEEGLKALNEFKIDLLFLDIEMPGMSGFELLERSRNQDFGVIFTTAHVDYAVQALRRRATDYLSKPIQQKELDAAVLSFVNQGNNQSRQPQQILQDQTKVRGNDFPEKIALPSLDGIVFFDINTIVVALSDGNLSKIYLTTGEEIYINQSLKYIEGRLEPLGFMRVHKCYLINLNKVRRYTKKEGGYIEMENQMLINISRNKRELFLKALERFGG